MFQILRGDAKIPKWLSPGARDILRRILDPSPITRINVAGIKAHEWFKQDYVAAIPSDDEEDPSLSVLCKHNESDEIGTSPTHINAFQLIGMSSSLDLSGFFEKEVICSIFDSQQKNAGLTKSSLVTDLCRMSPRGRSGSHPITHQNICLRRSRTSSLKWDSKSRKDMAK